MLSILLACPISVYQEITSFGVKELITFDKCLEKWPKFYRIFYSIIILIIQLLIPNTVLFISYHRIKKHLRFNCEEKNNENNEEIDKNN